ncbi:ankyrin unc44 [Colletotrichum plurivorum]|uniref:Ankyrin unc44 n=1 Tax=Colletotrichum plurivorum TaxID=2175906 RepID=A0A8H6MZB4_9PEZI|nr:ankyrin unc44 [Colletotrichum plurivorum]
MTDAFDLPTEIWLAIANLSGRRKASMAIWSRVCQKFRTMFQPELFWLAIQKHDSAITLKAAISGNLDTLKMAASCGANLNAIYRLRTPPWFQETEVPADEEDLPRPPEEQLPEACFGSLIHLATISGHYHVVRWLIDQQVDLEAPARFLCTWASLATVPFSSFEITRDRDPSDFPPWTALHYALCKRQDSIACLFISARASSDDVRVPVSTALQKLSDRIDAASLPYPSPRYPEENQRYADEEKDGRHPIPALHVAAANNRRRMVAYLVRDLGIDVETKDGQGATSLHHAVNAYESSYDESCPFTRDPEDGQLSGGDSSSDDDSSSVTSSLNSFNLFHTESPSTSGLAKRRGDWDFPMLKLMISRLGADGYARFHHTRAGVSFDTFELAYVMGSCYCKKYLLRSAGFSWLRVGENNSKEARVKFLLDKLLLDDLERRWSESRQASQEGYSVEHFGRSLIPCLHDIITAAKVTHEEGGGYADLNSGLSTAFSRICSLHPRMLKDNCYTILRSGGSLVQPKDRNCLYDHEFDPKFRLDGFELPRHATTNIFTLAFCFTISNWPKDSDGLLKNRILALVWAMQKGPFMRFAGDMEFSPLACLFKRMKECNSDPMDFADIIVDLGELGAWDPLQGQGQSNLPTLFHGLVFTRSGSAGEFYDKIQKSMREEAVDALQLNDLRRRCPS